MYYNINLCIKSKGPNPSHLVRARSQVRIPNAKVRGSNRFVVHMRFFCAQQLLRFPTLLACPHGGGRPFHQKSNCITQITLGPYVVQIWSRYGGNFDPTKPSYSSEWFCSFCEEQMSCSVRVSRTWVRSLRSMKSDLLNRTHNDFIDRRDPTQVLPQVAGFRRAPVQTKGTENGDLIPV